MVLRSAGGLASVALLLSQTAVYGRTVGVLAIPEQDVQEIKLSTAPILEIGREGDPAFEFTTISGVRLLGDGSVVVGDEDAREIRVFGADGTHLVTLGGVGDGPGEFRSLNGLWTEGDVGIGAWDAENQRITIFSVHGRVPTIKAGQLNVPSRAGMGNPPEAFVGVFANGDVVLASLAFGASTGTGVVPDRWTLGRFGSDGSFQEVLGELRGMRRLRRFPLPFSPVPHVAVTGDRVLAADGYDGTVRVAGAADDSGTEFALPPRSDNTPGVAEAWAALRTELEANGGNLFLERMRGMPRPEVFPEVGDMLSPKRLAGVGVGALWVRRFDPLVDSIWLGAVRRTGSGEEWTVFDAGGTVIHVVRVPDGFIPMHVVGDRVAGITIGLFGVERVAVYAIDGELRGS